MLTPPRQTAPVILSLQFTDSHRGRRCAAMRELLDFTEQRRHHCLDEETFLFSSAGDALAMLGEAVERNILVQRDEWTLLPLDPATASLGHSSPALQAWLEEHGVSLLRIPGLGMPEPGGAA